MIIRIPFQGWYQSELQDHLDQELELTEYPEETVNWIATHLQVTKEYAKLWALETSLEAKFEKMVSPREYNFDTDALLMKFSSRALQDIKDEVTSRLTEFRIYVMDHCSHRPGFYSSLPNDFREWPLIWKEAHYQVALLFLEEDSGIEENISESMSCNGGFELELFDSVEN